MQFWKPVLFLTTLLVSTQAAPAPIHADHESDIPQTHFVYFDLEHGGDSLGTIKIALFGSVVPRTVENFFTLATNPYEGSGSLSYTNSTFHRIIKDFMIQGGDFENADGTGGQSIYGSSFEDENFKIRHDVLGRVSMANAGKDSNGSQFFITAAITNWLDGKHVVFGQVVDGLDLILEKVQTVDVSEKHNKPLKDVKIVKSWGEVNPDVTAQKVKDFQEVLMDEESEDKGVNSSNEMFVFGGLIVLIVVYLGIKIFKRSRMGARYASLRE